MSVIRAAGVAFAVGMAGLAGLAKADTWTWSCNVVLRTPENAKAGNPLDWPKTPVALTADRMPGGKIAVRGPAFNVDLVTEDPNGPDWQGAYEDKKGHIVLSEGKAAVTMFSRTDVEACIDRVRKARPTAFASREAMVMDQDLYGCYAAASMTPRPVPADVSFMAYEEERNGATHRWLNITFFHEGQDRDDPLLDIKQMSALGPCEPN